MSYGTWQFDFTASDFNGKLSDVIFDMESHNFADHMWFEEQNGTINITQASDEIFRDSDAMLDAALSRLWEVHEATITGYVLEDSDDGSRYRGEWCNDDGIMKWGEGIDPAEYTVEQLQKIKEYADKLKEGQ